ncbi:hypothetical protein GO009_05495 [Muricauda sp. TY007]|uniref:hypothetical protein n=1 Tax=Allomuricauda sp. TY007 TaxID=2683200 RepID=UPI0013C297D5|nr:hypothetical protein [Muricauda sp. TY007]NDV15475.1 hypothetical protein [Muricauda sp. TY007]
MDKLEKHIKEKLKERTIAPSANAWDKIALQVKEPSPRKKNTWFPYAIAASVVGIVFVSIFFFAKDNPEAEQIQVVETDTKTAKEIEPEHKVVKEFVQEEQTEVVETGLESVTPEKTEEFSPKESISKAAVAEQEVKQPLQDEVIINSNKLIAQKVGEVVAQVELMETAQRDVSDAEVDSLLRAAQRQILTDKLFSESGSVDAMSLLAEVEDELDESFRDQIFDALKSGYLKLRTAVADRNQ